MVLSGRIRNYLDTVSEFPITVSEYAYPLTRDGNGLVLEKIFTQDSDDLQGLITIAWIMTALLIS